jgi:Histidine kinase-like ATPase domain
MTLTAPTPAPAIADGCELRLLMTAHVRTARLPRRLAGIALGTWGLGHLEDRVTVILSELVTNVVKLMPGTEVEVGVGVRDGWLWLEVSDTSPRVPGVPATPSLTDEGGRGLFVAEALADKFGIERRPPDPGGKTIWAALQCESLESGHDSR